MNIRRLEVIEIENATDRLRCYLSAGADGTRRARARLLRGGKVVEENVFVFEARVSLRDLATLLETAMGEIAAVAGGRIRIMTAAGGEEA